jgi:hypothetical protein
MEKCNNCGAIMDNGRCPYCGAVSSRPQPNQGTGQFQGAPGQNQGMPQQFQGMPQQNWNMPPNPPYMQNGAPYGNPYGGYQQLPPRKKFWQKNWFLYLILLIAPYIGIILLWTIHRDDKISKKIMLSMVAALWFFSIIVINQNFNTEDDLSASTGPKTGYTASDKDATADAENPQDAEKEEVSQNTQDTEETEETAAKDFSDVAAEYELSAGNYTAGIDIPAGKSNVVAVSGTGNLSSSNMFSGGINEMFGVDDGNGFYTESFNGLKLSEGDVLTVSGRLTIKMEYTDIQSNVVERIYGEENKITLTDGNYEAGVDFPEGTYNIAAVSGAGNLSSSNMFEGGVNEMFGIDDEMGFYTEETKHIPFPAGTALEISGGLTVDLVPCE